MTTPARKVNGIGPRAHETLAAIGITAVGEARGSHIGPHAAGDVGRNFAE
jgi:hypothetical protein